jgi:hypothetical protein
MRGHVSAKKLGPRAGRGFAFQMREQRAVQRQNAIEFEWLRRKLKSEAGQRLGGQVATVERAPRRRGQREAGLFGRDVGGEEHHAVLSDFLLPARQIVGVVSRDELARKAPPKGIYFFIRLLDRIFWLGTLLA